MRVFPALALVLALGAPADVTPVLRTEIGRVRESAAKVVPAEQRPGLDARLKRAGDALAARRPLLALLELQAAWEMESGFAFSAASGVKTQEEFLHKWKELGVPALPTAAPDPSRPLALEALADSSQARGPAIYRASLPYSEDAGLPAGLYYLGESHAGAKFASFLRRLEWGQAEARPPLRSIAPELDAFEAEVVQSYERAEASLRPSYIGVNVTLKLTRELDTQRRHAAALLEYLRARYRYTAVRAEAGEAAQVKARIAQAQRGLAGADHSIAQLFLELAAANAESQDAQVARGAVAILDNVIPAYLAVVKR